MIEKSLFLSYTSADSMFVKRLAGDCEKKGIHVFYFERDLKPGDNIWSNISSEIIDKSVVGVVLSPNSANSEGVLREIELAYQHFGRSKNIFLVPILKEPLDRNKIPDKLRGLLWADFTKS